MKTPLFRRTCFMLTCVSILQIGIAPLLAELWDPAAPDYAGNKGKTLYVSKLGDNSDGSSWQKAFRTIQQALLAVPDDKGGHTVVLRPDTYYEANLYPAHKGAPGAYNLLVGDSNGRLGSGTKGRVVIDTSDPDKGNIALNWWGTWRGDAEQVSGFDWDLSADKKQMIKRIGDAEQFSGFDWDRWIFRNLYAAGSEGMWWDGYVIGQAPEFSIVVEKCVGLGRFCGAMVGNFVGRQKEPVLFRDCYFMNFDWFGDSAGVYMRAEHKTMPDWPDAIFEDCTIVGPNNAVQTGNGGIVGYTRLMFRKCRLIALNFSLPEGTPSTGIITSRAKGDYLHVDLEDCDLMGYKVFGIGLGYMEGGQRLSDPEEPGRISYTTKGQVRAWVQSTQPLPEGFERFHGWPTELFDAIAPPGRAR